ncbi:MAG: DUF2974 domain-containing protein [Eubacterium sp.]|nr:DUF2974 domain-containing protein [Eubacterium sp.]
MKTLFDYIEEFATASFSTFKLTEVDNVIFCRLSYLNFNGFEGKTLKYIAKHFNDTDEEASTRANKNIIKTEELLKLLGTTNRYKNVVISDFKECTDENCSTAFSATAFKFQDKSYYIAYRGTDEKLLSFYEDAELAYDFPIPVQLEALRYTKELVHKFKGKYILGGHSRGGNLAMFSFMFLDKKLKKRVQIVYNNDGPGFPKNLAPILFTEENCEKIINLFPKDSIVGRMLETCGKTVIIKSSAVAVGQHNLFTWITNGYEFERTENFSNLSNYVDDSLTASLDTLSPADLKKTVDAIYSIAKNSGLNTLEDINKSNYANILLSVLQTVKSEENASSEAGEIIKTLSKSLINSVDIEKRLPDVDIGRIKELIENRKAKAEKTDES